MVQPHPSQLHWDSITSIPLTNARKKREYSKEKSHPYTMTGVETSHTRISDKHRRPRRGAPAANQDAGKRDMQIIL